jgi:hypothetical protein
MSGIEKMLDTLDWKQFERDPVTGRIRTAAGLCPLQVLTGHATGYAFLAEIGHGMSYNEVWRVVAAADRRKGYDSAAALRARMLRRMRG